jgi:hypothetical protein
VICGASGSAGASGGGGGAFGFCSQLTVIIPKNNKSAMQKRLFSFIIELIYEAKYNLNVIFKIMKKDEQH